MSGDQNDNDDKNLFWKGPTVFSSNDDVDVDDDDDSNGEIR